MLTLSPVFNRTEGAAKQHAGLLRLAGVPHKLLNKRWAAMKTPLLRSANLAWWAPTELLDAWGTSVPLPRTDNGGAGQPAQTTGVSLSQLGHRSPPPQMLLSTPGYREEHPAA